jgi:hypothetical protein
VKLSVFGLFLGKIWKPKIVPKKIEQKPDKPLFKTLSKPYFFFVSVKNIKKAYPRFLVMWENIKMGEDI